MFGQLLRCQPVQIEHEDQAAVRRDTRAREQFYIAQKFTEILNDHFVLPQHFVDDNSHASPAHSHNHHAEITV